MTYQQGSAAVGTVDLRDGNTSITRPDGPARKQAHVRGRLAMGFKGESKSASPTAQASQTSISLRKDDRRR